MNRTGNDDDYRCFTLTRSRRVRLELRNLTADANLFLESASGQVLQSSRRSGTANDAIVRILTAGTYYVRVDANAPGTTRYQLRYRTERAPDPGTTRESAWYIGNLTNVSGYQTNSGTVNRTSDASDYRRFTLTTARTMRFDLRNLSANADLFLEDASGRVLQSIARRSGTANDAVVRIARCRDLLRPRRCQSKARHHPLPASLPSPTRAPDPGTTRTSPRGTSAT